MRWEPQTWTAERARQPAWGRLLELGRAGRAVRRLRVDPSGDAVEFEVTEPV